MPPLRTPEEICRELWLAIDAHSKSIPFGNRVRETMSIHVTAQNLVTQIEALLKTARDMEAK